MTSPKISLCIITGNCIEYIDRCLSSFGPYVDEIIVVRAIGNQISDATLDRACGKYGAITGEYFNAPEHRDWPHVDNFAAARNLSFSLATGDYILWADTDDILESGGELIRELANRGGYALKPDYRPLTKFENRGLKLGHGVWDLVFKRV